MFDNLLRELERIKRNGGKMTVPIQIPLDEDGYFDRRCPSDACQACFKVLMEDWKNKVSDDRVYCPTCREEAKSTEWNTPEQGEYIRRVAIGHVHDMVGRALSQDAKDFNRKQRPGFITLSMSYKPGTPPMILPISAAEQLRQKFICEQCGCRYSSLGAAFFCPACGHNSAESTFRQTIETVRKSLMALPGIRDAVQSTVDADAAENTVRELLESSVGRIVGAFQRMTEALFDRAPAAMTTRRRKNVFQSLTEGSILWQNATGKSYEDLLTAKEMTDLFRLFQQRHILAHCEGVVDQDYIDKSRDTTYDVGQRLVIQEGVVNRLAEIVVKLIEELKKLV